MGELTAYSYVCKDCGEMFYVAEAGPAHPHYHEPKMCPFCGGKELTKGGWAEYYG